MKALVSVNPGTVTDKASLPWIAKAMLLSKSAGIPITEAVQTFGERFPERAARIIKTAVETGTTTGWAAALTPDVTTAQNGFDEGARNSSVFLELLASGAIRRTPMRTRFTAVTASATGFVRGERSARPISKFTLAGSTGLQPIEACAFVVVTDELIKLPTPEAQGLFSAELSGAVGSVADVEFMRIVAAAKAATYVSYGSTFDAARADIQRAMAAITTDKRSRLVWIGGASVAKGASVLASNSGFLFPGMTPMGGEMLGLPFLVSDGIATDTLYLVDADKIAGNADPTTFDLFREATIEMETTPDSPETAATELVNLWQRNLVALLASAFIAAEVRTATAVAELTGVTWGAYSPDSPT